MDEELKNAAIKGDVKFLKHVVDSGTPLEYFQSSYNPRNPDSEQGGNIFHLAAWNKRTEFLTEAMEMLPPYLVHFLLYQQDSRERETPLHIASWKGYNKIVKEILNYYEESLSASSSSSTAQSDDSPYTVKPWLIKNISDRTPFHYMVSYCREECALQLLSMDADVFSIMGEGDQYGGSPFVDVLARGFNRVVLKFFNSAPNSVWASFDRLVLIKALGSAPNCSDEIFRLVLEKNRELIEDKDIFDQDILEILGECLIKWADKGKLYPFEYVLKSNDYAPRLRRYLIDLIPQQHILQWIAYTPNCDEDTKVQIAKIIVDAYEEEKRGEFKSGQLELPWLVTYNGHKDSLYHAVDEHNEKLALYLLSLDVAKLLLGKEDQILFLAIEKNCQEVAKKILDLVHQHGMTTLLTSSTGQTILHNVPKCKDELILKRVAERHLYLVEQFDDDEVNVLHSWIKIGELWPFEYVLKRNDINHEFRKKLIGLLHRCDDRGRNPLHVAAEFGASGVTEPIVQLLLNAYQKFGFTTSSWIRICETPCVDYNLPDNPPDKDSLGFEYTGGPWSKEDNEGNTPQRKAISAGRDQLALQLLSPQRFDFEAKDILFTAIENKCHHVVKYFLDLLYQKGCKSALLRFSEKNVLHIASKCSEANGKLIIERWPHFINEHDPNGKTPLQIASEEGASWLVRLILEMDRDSLLKVPKAWVEACKRGHLSTVLTFVESTYFKYVCQVQNDTPLHHIKFDAYNKYQELLKCSLMDELKNVQDYEGNTPLHKAIKDRNKELTEILFTMEDIYWNIKNKDQKTAMNLLEEAIQDPEWDILCKRLGIDPRLKITYIKTDVTHIRGTISLVATLLATITFTAGFTLPGGFNNDNGDAILARKAAFLVFMIADVYAMCSSMLVLLCVVWSMLSDRSKASFLAKRSLELMQQSLYGTLVAFMTGVYAVIHKKSMWAAILVIVVCSALVILPQRRVIYNVFEMSDSVARKVDRIQMKCYGKWTSFVNSVFRRKQQAVLPHNQSQDEEAAPLTNQSEHQEIPPLNNQSQDGEAAPLTDQREDQETRPLTNRSQDEEAAAPLSEQSELRLDSIV